MTPFTAASWFPVSPGHQDPDNQVPAARQFAAHHGHEIAESYAVSDTAWEDGGGPDYCKTLKVSFPVSFMFV
jgi:hypothetical protein